MDDKRIDASLPFLMNKPIILDLCAGTGAWSQPYVDAGYDVRRITLPDQDVRLFKAPAERIHGILAAPPCTHFSIVGVKHWKTKDSPDLFDAKGKALLLQALSVVDACLRIIHTVKPDWWALENPVGRLKYWIGNPRYTFQPWEYGDPWTKRTCIWGEHTQPTKYPVKSLGQWIGRTNKNGVVDHLKSLPRESFNRSTLRSITPPGFTKAFFDANP